MKVSISGIPLKGITMSTERHPNINAAGLAVRTMSAIADSLRESAATVDVTKLTPLVESFCHKVEKVVDREVNKSNGRDNIDNWVKHSRPHVRELYARLKISHFFVSHDNKPYACIALGYDEQRDEMRVGVSICHGNDQFNRVSGRAKARGRVLAATLKTRFTDVRSADERVQQAQVRYMLRHDHPRFGAFASGDWEKIAEQFVNCWKHLVEPKPET